jgi:hypothetical protein
MRFCPFCAQENNDDARECGHCGKRLPAVPHRTPSPPPTRPAPAAPPVRPRPAPRSRPLTASAAPAGDTVLTPAQQPTSASGPAASAHAPGAATTAQPPAAARGTAPGFGSPSSAPAGSAASDAPARAPAPGARRPTPAAGVSVRSGTPAAGVPARAGTPAAGVPARAGSPAAGVPARSGTPAAGVPTRSSSDEPSLAPERKRSGTLLGMPDPAGSSAAAPDDSARRTTKPLGVGTAAKAAGLGTPAAPIGRDDGRTEPTPRLEPDDFGGETHDDHPVGTQGPIVQTVHSEASAPTPLMPTLALPPMPPPPKKPSVLASVTYLWPLARAVWARRQAQKSIRELLHGDQRLLDQVLRDLGRAAREENLEVPAVAEEMRRVREQEERRTAAEAASLKADADADAERARWAGEETERQSDIAQRDSELRTSEQELKLKNDERRVHESERARLDAQIKAAEAKAQSLDARAIKASQTPPEKGGGPNTAANLRTEAESARREASSLVPARDAAAGKVVALDTPIAALDKHNQDARAALQGQRKELADASAAHKAALADFEAAKKKAEQERDAAEREMSQRFVAAGTLLNLNRVDSPKFAPLYERIDELKGGVNAREAAIVRLESERRSYDREALQKGLITVGIAFGVLIILTIVLIVLIAR